MVRSSRNILKLFHMFVPALNLYTIWYDQMYVDLPFPSKDIEAMPLKARHLFLTVWCLWVQTLYFSVAFLNDVYGTDSPAPKKPPIIRRIKDILFGLALTLALYVSPTFWGIYSINKDLIFPIEIESKIPVWVNHVMHTLIVPFILVELISTNRNYPSRRFGINMMLTCITSYTCWVLYIHYKTDVWAYPFLGVLNWVMRGAFFAGSLCVGLVIYILGERLDSLVSQSVKVYTDAVKNGIKKAQ